MIRRLIFMGTPGFAAKSLEALIKAGYDIAAIYSQPPKPADRGMTLRKSAVQVIAEHHNLPVFTPASLKDVEVQQVFAAHQADIAIVAAYGLILPEAILSAPRHGCLNIHASLLPRWRGAAPIQRAILAGDALSGISIMQMEKGLDTGPVLLKKTVPIEERMNSLMLHDRLADLGADSILEALRDYSNLTPITQDSALVTYAEKLSKQEGKLDWQKDAALLDRQIRAFTPWPGAYALLPKGDMLKIHQAIPIEMDHHAISGTILDDRMVIACGSQALLLQEVQRAGKKPMSAIDFMRGAQMKVGDRLN